MEPALWAAKTGLDAQQTQMTVTANNLANVNTTGFKRSRIEFQDLLYDTVRAPGAEQSNGTQLPTGLQVGHGSQAVSTSQIFTEGELTQTGGQLDMAIQGDGFFQVTMPDGTLAYTRDGSLHTDSQGRVTTANGLVLQSGFQAIPTGTTGINIGSDGTVTTTSASGTQTFRVQLTRFANPAGLQSEGQNLYIQTPASGTPETGNPGENGYGTMQQGYLEMSNVSVVQEMVNMIVAQRAYEVNSKAVQAADEMMSQANNLRH